MECCDLQEEVRSGVAARQERNSVGMIPMCLQGVYVLLLLFLVSFVYCFWNGIKRRKFGLKNNLCGLMDKDNIHNSLRQITGTRQYIFNFVLFLDA